MGWRILGRSSRRMTFRGGFLGREEEVEEELDWEAAVVDADEKMD